MPRDEPPLPPAPGPEDFEDCIDYIDHIKHKISDHNLTDEERAHYDRIRAKIDKPRPKLRRIK